MNVDYKALSYTELFYSSGVNFLFLFVPALPHTGSLGPVAGGFGASSMQKAQSLIDLGSSRYGS